MAENDSMAMFRDSAANFLSATDQRQRARALEDAGGGFDRSTWRQLANLGWWSVLVGEADGGLGLGIAEVAAIAEEAGRHLVPEPLIDAGVHPPALLARLPTSGLRDELLAGIQSGETVAGVAWQECAGELEATSGMASATVDGDIAALTGLKRLVRPGAGADGWIVCANLDDEPALFWVAAQASGRAVSQDAGVDGGAIASLALDNAPGRLLARGESALAALQQAGELARIAQGAELVGVARRSLELTRDYLTTRVQFGKPIGSFRPCSTGWWTG